MRRLGLVLALIGGCDFFSDEEAQPVEVVATAAVDTAAAPEPAEPLQPPRSDIDTARDLAVAGDYPGAIKAARALLAEDAANAAAWRLLKYAAITGGQAAEVAADLPAGPRAAVTRAALMVAAKDAAGALTAAQALQAERPRLAATYIARAAMLGADPGALEGKVAALVGFATAADDRQARPFAETAKAVGGWQAALLRAELAVARDHGKQAFAEFKAVVEADNPEATYLGNIGRHALAKKSGKATQGRSADGPLRRPAKQVAKWIQAAHDVALAEGWTSRNKDWTLGIGKLTRLTVVAQLKAERPRKAQAAAQAALDRVTVAGGTPTGGLNLEVARSALAAGDVVTAATAAGTARARYVEKGEDQQEEVPEGRVRGKGKGKGKGKGRVRGGARTGPVRAASRAEEASWIAGRAAYALGRIDAVNEAAGQVSGARKDVLKALALLAAGNMKRARMQFPTSGLKPADGAFAYAEAARTSRKHALEWHNASIKAADRSGQLSARIGTRLAKESTLRSRNLRAAAQLRAETAALAPNGTHGDPLRMELAARAVLAGETPPFPAGEGRPAVIGAWEAMSSRRKPPKAEDEAHKGMVQWARGRAAAAHDNLDGHDAHFRVALGKLPLHRQGPMDPITVLDGSEGVDVDTDLLFLVEIKGERSVGMALQAHDVGHRMDTISRDLSLGRQPFASLSDELREPLLAAVARVRSRVLSWLSGSGDYPSAAFTALGEVETAAAEDAAFKSLMPVPGASVQDLMTQLGNAAVLSLRIARGKVHGVALSRLGSRMRLLGDAKEIKGLAEGYYAALDVAASQQRKTEHGAGDALRRKLLDPFIGDLVGVGKYVIVGPPQLTGFPYTTMPEQAEGLRWLADIRQMSAAPTVASLTRELRTVDQNTYKLDFLGFSSDAPALTDDSLSEYEIPDELKTCAHHFQSGFAETRVGADATAASWLEKSVFARYIHITGLSSAPRGGFQMVDGPLSLETIRNTPLHAELVVITARATQAQQIHRARAFLDAGAKWVLVAMWDIPDRTRVRFLSNIYDSINQERPPVRALSEGRQSLFRDSLTGIDLDDPSLWGGLLLFGAP